MIAIVDILRSSRGIGGKLLWILLIIFFPIGGELLLSHGVSHPTDFIFSLRSDLVATLWTKSGCWCLELECRVVKVDRESCSLRMNKLLAHVLLLYLRKCQPMYTQRERRNDHMK